MCIFQLDVSLFAKETFDFDFRLHIGGRLQGRYFR